MIFLFHFCLHVQDLAEVPCDGASERAAYDLSLPFCLQVQDLAEVPCDEAPGHHGVPVRRVWRGFCHAEAAAQACCHHARQ